MPRLLPTTGDAVMGIAGGAISINGAIPPGLASFGGGGWDWYDSDRIFGQGIDGTGAHLYLYRISTNTVTLVDSRGADFTAAGGGVWNAWLGGQGWFTSTGLGPDASRRVGDVSEIGEQGYVADVAINSFAVLDATNNVIDSFGLEYWGSPITVRQGYFTALRRDGFVGLRNYRAPQFVALFNRSGNSWVTHVVDGTDIWLLERGADGALTIRKKDDNFGWLVEPASFNIYNPDVVRTSAGNVRIAWSTNQGESPDALVGVQLALATGVNTRGTVVGSTWTFVAAPALSSVPFSGSAGTGGGSTGTGGGIGGGFPSGIDTLKGDTGVARVRRQPQRREYPEVAAVSDGPAQRSLKLLWDKVWAFEDRHTTQEATLGTLESGFAAMNNELRRVRTLSESSAVAATLPTGVSSEPPGPGGPPGVPPITPPPGPPAPGSGTDDGLGAQGCSQAGATGHVTAGVPLTAVTVGIIVCGTAHEFPSLLAATVDQATRDANQAQLLGRIIWHLAQAGFQSGKQRNPSGAISGDKITVMVDSIWRAYDCFTGPPFTTPLDVHCSQVFPAEHIPDGGVAD